MRTRISRFLPILMLAVACIIGATLSVHAAPSLEEPKAVPGAAIPKAAQYANPKITTPKLRSIKNVGGGVKLTWSRSSGADGYIILRAAPTDRYFTRIKYVEDPKAVNYVDKTAISGERYCYSIRAYTGAPRRISGLSGYDTFGTYFYYLRRAKLNKLTDSAKGITIKWRKEPTATGYIIYRRLSTSNTWTELTRIKKNSTLTFVDTTAKQGKTYHYRICSFRGSSLGYISTTLYLLHALGF